MATVPNAPAWLTAAPIAHRGLHNSASGIFENTVSAAEAAIEHGYAIECDVQETKDDGIIVFHDDDLDRLTSESGRVKSKDKAQLKCLCVGTSNDNIPCFFDFLDIIGGKVPLIVEIKSSFDGNTSLAERVCKAIRGYAGPVALKSFDPDVVKTVRSHAPNIPRGIIGLADYSHTEWDGLSADKKFQLANLLHFPQTEPDFLSWHVGDLRHSAPFLTRLLGMRPVLTWTVRSSAQSEEAAQYADQIIFEGFTP